MRYLGMGQEEVVQDLQVLENFLVMEVKTLDSLYEMTKVLEELEPLDYLQDNQTIKIKFLNLTITKTDSRDWTVVRKEF